MRTTQFIGLNSRGVEFANHCKLDKDNLTNNHTTGMFDEKIPLRTWGNGKFREKVQVSPWSSGPMIFTAIQHENGEWVKETLWIEGTPEDSEYDFKTGRYYV